MNCQRNLELLHPYIDRELEQVLASEVKAHLEQCKACDVSYRGQIALRSSLHDGSFYHRAPADLKSRIASSLQKEASQDAHTATSTEVTSRRELQTS